MSQPRRRRRRRRKSGAPSEQSASSQERQGQQRNQPPSGSAPARKRRRRGRSRGEAKRQASPKSSEDLVRARPKERPATLTAPADGQTLEGIIGDLQSQYGVPQYPQEYRITIKVADENQRGEVAVVEERKQDPETAKTNGPKREKAPAAPLLLRGDGSAPSPNKRKKRGRRGRRRRGGGGGEGGSGSSGGEGGSSGGEGGSSGGGTPPS